MIEKIQVELNRCTCSCGHTWLSDEVPKRCAGCRSRNWNSDDRPEPKKILVSKLESEAESDVDPFSEPEHVNYIQLGTIQTSPPEVPAPKPKSSGSKIAEELLARMASKLGRPAHAPNCTCYTCKPPKVGKGA